MPLSFDDIYRGYQGSGLNAQFSLADYARLGNFVTSSNDYNPAVNGAFGQTVKEGNYWLNQGINATGVPDALGNIGSTVYGAFGGTPDSGYKMGSSFPRQVVNFLPWLAAAAAAPETGGLSLAGVAGLGGTAALSAADTYGEGGTPGQTLMSAASPLIGSVGGKFAGAFLRPTSEALLAGGSKLGANALQFAGEQAGAIGSMEGASRFFGTNQTPFFSTDNLLNTILGNAPFVGHSAIEAFRHGGVVQPPQQQQSTQQSTQQSPAQPTTPVSPTPAPPAQQQQQQIVQNALVQNAVVTKAAASMPSESNTVDVKAAADDKLKSTLGAVTEIVNDADLKGGIASQLVSSKVTVELPTLLGLDPKDLAAATPAVVETGKASDSIAPLVDAFKVVNRRAAMQKAQEKLDAQIPPDEQGQKLQTSIDDVKGALTKSGLTDTKDQTQVLNLLGLEDGDVGPKSQALAKHVTEEVINRPAEETAGQLAVALAEARGEPSQDISVVPAATKIDAAKAVEALHGLFGVGEPATREAEGRVVEPAANKDSSSDQDTLGNAPNPQAEAELRQTQAAADQVVIPPPSEVTTHDQASDLLLQANNLRNQTESSNVTDAEVNVRVDQLVKDGVAPTKAVATAATSIAQEGKVATKDLVAEKLRQEEIRKKRAEGGKKGGRPKTVGIPEGDLNAINWFNDFVSETVASQDPGKLVLLEKVKAAVNEPEKFFTRSEGLSTMRTGAAYAAMRAARAKIENPNFQAMLQDKQEQVLVGALRKAVNWIDVPRGKGGKPVSQVEVTPELDAEISKAVDVQQDGTTDGERAVESQADHITDLLNKGVAGDIATAFSDPTNPMYEKLMDSPLIQKVVNNRKAGYPESAGMRDAIRMMYSKNPDVAKNFLKGLAGDLQARGSEGGLFEVTGAGGDGLRPGVADAAQRVLIKQGVTPEQAEMLANTFIPKALAGLNLEGTRFGELINDEAGMVKAGMSAVTGPLKAIWLAADAAGKGSPEQMARNLAVFIAHEAGHGIEQLYNNKLLDNETMQQFDELQNDFANRSNEDNGTTLQVMAESLLPKDWQELEAVKGLLNPTNPQEALATAHAFWALGSAAKSTDAELGATVMPRAARNWFQTMTDWARKLIGSLKSAFMIRPEEGDLGRVNDIVDKISAMKAGFDKAEQTVQEFNSFWQVDQSSLAPMRVSQLKSLDESTAVTNETLMRMATREVGPETTMDKIGKQVSRFTESLEQLAQRFPKVAGAAWSVLNMPIHKGQITSRLMAPFFCEADANGMSVWSAKQEKMYKTLSTVAPVNRLASDILLWEQKELDAGKQTQFDLSKPSNSDLALSNRLSQLNPDSQATIKSYITAQRLSNKESQSSILDYTQKSNTVKTALVIATKDPTMRPQAKDIAEQLYQASMLKSQSDQLLAGNPTGAQQGVALAQQSQMLMDQVKQILNPNTFAAAADFASTAADGQLKLKEFFDGRPNFASRVITGSHIIRGYDISGRQVGAEPIKDGSQRKTAESVLRQKNAVSFKYEEVKRGFDVEMDDKMRDMMDHVENSWSQKLLQYVDPNKIIQPDALSTFLQEQPLMSEFDRVNQASKIIQPGSRSKTSESSIDMIEAHRTYSSILANMLTSRLAKANLAYEMEEPGLSSFPDQVKQVQESMQAYQQPDSPTARALTRFMSTYYLGFNVPTDFAVMMHGLFTILPESISRTGSIIGSSKLLGGALKDLAGYYAKKVSTGTRNEFDLWGDKGTAGMFKSMDDAGMLHRSAFHDGLDDEGLSAVRLHQLSNQGVLGAGVSKIGSMWNAYSNMTMKFFETFTGFNARVAALMGYRQALAAGLPHDQAVQNAMEFTTTSTFASGKAGRPVGMFTGTDHTVGQIAYAMQRYSLGCMSMLGRYAQHATTSAAGAAELGLRPGQQAASAKALTTALGIRFAAAGALGLPFVGAINAAVGKITHHDLGSSIYSAFGQGMDQDEKEGSIIADSAVHGFANALLARVGLPVDVASKFSMAGLPGMSSTDVFDPGSIFGPSASMVKSMVQGATDFANDRGLTNVGKSILPPAYRKILDIWANGDATDKNSRPEGLSDLEKTLYAIGFPTQRQSKTREFQHYSDLAAARTKDQEGKDVAKIMDLYNTGDVGGAQDAMQQIVSDSGNVKDPLRLAKEVAKQTVDKQFPVDPRQKISPENAVENMHLMRGLGLPLGSSQEYMRELAMREIEKNLSGGFARPHISYGGPLGRAQAEDDMTAQNPLTPFSMAFQR